MNFPRGLVGLVLFAVCTSACGGKSSSSPTGPSTSGSATTISAVASGYIASVVDLMAAHSVYRRTTDWNAFRQSVLNKAGAAQTIPDAYPAIEFALELLGDTKAWLSKPDGSYLPGLPRPACSSDAHVVPDLTVYTNVRRIPLAACNGCNATQYTDGVRDLIAKSDSSGVSGWIVDLRGNNGGNIWPMIAGIGPLLGNGTAGAFVDPYDQKATIGYQDGVALAAGVAQWTLTNPYQVYTNPAKVAVITDISTSGGGEILAILFRGRPNTRSFGSPSCGIPGAVSNYTLSDNSVLFLTTMLTADRNGVTYPGSVQPDVIAGDLGEAVMRAAEWLQGK